MFDWLKKTKPAASPSVPPLYFKDNAAAFKFACDSLLCEVKTGSYLPALVQDASELLGAGRAVKKQPDRNQTALLTIAARDGGFTVAAATAGPNGPDLQPGDLVAWLAGDQIAHLQGEFEDPRMTWAGVIVARLRPEYTEGRGWAIDRPFN